MTGRKKSTTVSEAMWDGFKEEHLKCEGDDCKLLVLCRHSSVSEMFVMNNISNFEALIRKSIFAFKTRLSNSDNTISEY